MFEGMLAMVAATTFCVAFFLRNQALRINNDHELHASRDNYKFLLFTENPENMAKARAAEIAVQIANEQRFKSDIALTTGDTAGMQRHDQVARTAIEISQRAINDDWNLFPESEPISPHSIGVPLLSAPKAEKIPKF